VGQSWDNQFVDLVSRRLQGYREEPHRAADGSEPAPTVYALDLPARAESLLPLTAFVTETARRGGLALRDTTFVEIAIYEACLNVIEHAYAFDASRRFRLDILEEEARLTFRITDTGAPIAGDLFDESADDSRDVSPQTRRAGRGLGLRIIRGAMDEVSYETDDCENRMVLVKRLRTAPARV